MRKSSKGLILVAVSALLFSLMSLFVKLCDLSSWEVFFIRGLFQALISLVSARHAKVSPFGYKGARSLLSLNGLFGALRIAFFFYSVKNGHLGDVTAIFFTAPAIVVLIGALFFKENLKVSTIFSILFCMSGTALVAKPQFLFGRNGSNKDDEQDALIIAVFGAIVSAAFYITIPFVNRKANDKAIIFYFGAISAIVSFIPMILSEPRWPSKMTWIWVGLVVICGYFGQVCLNTGLKIAKRSALLVRNIDVALAFAYAYFIFSKEVTLTSIIGATLICAGGALLVIQSLFENEDQLNGIEPLTDVEKQNFSGVEHDGSEDENTPLLSQL
eukprot:NODE_559_length_6687_cov_0.130237.p3 type:complete len:329 gc:universal NODE_559_length_6687_cov_0.130237:842-1828(+)